jgi:hypothetical protein
VAQRPDYAALAQQLGGRPADATPVDYAALARQHGGRLAQPAAVATPTLLERAVPMAVRLVPTIAGGVVGSLAGPVGTAAGGAAGAALGEAGAELLEQWTGQRAAINPTQVVVQAALGAIPLGRAVGATIPQIVARRALQGGGMGAVGSGLTESADTGQLPSARTVATGGVLGGLMGGGLGRVEGAAVSRARTVPAPPRRPTGLLSPGARFRAAPGGVVAEAGAEIPMARQPDGSFVRGVPAEYARREPRALLPAGPTFVAGEGGAVAPVADPDALAQLAARFGGQRVTPPPSASASMGRLVPAAVVARDIDVTQPTKLAVTVKQYSGDPTATNAPLLSEADTSMLRRMRADLEEFTPQRGRLVRDPQDDTAAVYAPGVRGSFVGEDVRVISGQRVGNDEIVQAIDDLLAGKTPTNRLHLAALDAAKGYLEKRPGYRGPMLPADVVEARTSSAASAPSSSRLVKLAEAESGADALEDLLARRGIGPDDPLPRYSGTGYGVLPADAPRGAYAGRGGEAVDEFERFLAAFEDIKPAPVRLP